MSCKTRADAHDTIYTTAKSIAKDLPHLYDLKINE